MFTEYLCIKCVLRLHYGPEWVIDRFPRAEIPKRQNPEKKFRTKVLKMNSFTVQYRDTHESSDHTLTQFGIDIERIQSTQYRWWEADANESLASGTLDERSPSWDSLHKIKWIFSEVLAPQNGLLWGTWKPPTGTDSEKAQSSGSLSIRLSTVCWWSLYFQKSVWI